MFVYRAKEVSTPGERDETINNKVDAAITYLLSQGAERTGGSYAGSYDGYFYHMDDRGASVAVEIDKDGNLAYRARVVSSDQEVLAALKRIMVPRSADTKTITVQPGSQPRRKRKRSRRRRSKR